MDHARHFTTIWSFYRLFYVQLYDIFSAVFMAAESSLRLGLHQTFA